MKRWLINTLLVVFILVFLVSGGFLLKYFLDSHQQQSSFDHLSNLMNNATTPGGAANQPADPNDPQQPTMGQTDDGETVSPYVQVTDPETGEIVEMLPEFAELYALNNDLVGWISIEGTNVNYPVLQTPDNKDYYLRRDYYGKYSNHGCIYVQESCDVYTPSDNVVIFGHRMSDGTMFYDLLKYKDMSFWEEHQYITFNTLKERHTYQVFAAFKIASGLDTPFPYHQFVNALDAGEFDQFIDNCDNYDLLSTGIVPTFGDKLITLSTCEYSQVNGRMVIVAVRID